MTIREHIKTIALLIAGTAVVTAGLLVLWATETMYNRKQKT